MVLRTRPSSTILFKVGHGRTDGRWFKRRFYLFNHYDGVITRVKFADRLLSKSRFQRANVVLDNNDFLLFIIIFGKRQFSFLIAYGGGILSLMRRYKIN